MGLVLSHSRKVTSRHLQKKTAYYDFKVKTKKLIDDMVQECQDPAHRKLEVCTVNSLKHKLLVYL